MSTRFQLTDTPTSECIQSRYFQHLRKQVYLFDSVFNGVTYIHVRKVLNEKIPTKDGITLNLQRCNELFMNLPQLDIAVHMMELNQPTFYRKHLGGNWYVTVQNGFKCVDIRKFWKPENVSEICATRKGVALNFEQYRELKNGLHTLDSFIPELRDIIPCYSTQNHVLQDCKECSPNNFNKNVKD